MPYVLLSSDCSQGRWSECLKRKEHCFLYVRGLKIIHTTLLNFFLKELHMALSDIVEDILNAHDTTKVRLAMSNLFFCKNTVCSKSRCVIYMYGQMTLLDYSHLSAPVVKIPLHHL